MATQAQILANRRNALRSTGPRSAEGKAVSRCNALKTGIQAKLQVIPGEDPAGLQQLADDYHRQFQPGTPLECFLVDSLVNSDWLLRRYRTVEAGLWQKALAPDVSGPGEAYDRHQQTFARLHRRIEALERSYFRALTELRRLQPIPEEEDDLEAAPAGPFPVPELASFSTSPAPAKPPPAPVEGTEPRPSGSGDI